jgi:hypothetical protein
MKTKQKREHREYDREILREAVRRVFGTDHPAVVAAVLKVRRRRVDNAYDEIQREQKETNR